MNELMNYLIDNLLPIGIAIAGLVAWFTERRKRKAEVKTVEVNNRQGEATAMTGMQTVYDQFVEDVRKQISELRDENKSLRSEIAELRKRLSGAESERVELTSKVHDLEFQNSELRKELDKYKKDMINYQKENRK